MSQHGQNGDHLRFEELVREHGQVIAVIVRRWAGYDDAAVEDLVQETYYRAWRYLASLDPAQDARGWLVGIALNVCRDWWRDRKRLPKWLDISDPAQVPAIDPSCDRGDESDPLLWLTVEVSSLPGGLGEVVDAGYQHDWNVPAMARVLGKTQQVIRSALSKLRSRILDSLGLGGWMRTWKAYYGSDKVHASLFGKQPGWFAETDHASRAEFWSNISRGIHEWTFTRAAEKTSGQWQREEWEPEEFFPLDAVMFTEFACQADENAANEVSCVSPAGIHWASHMIVRAEHLYENTLRAWSTTPDGDLRPHLQRIQRKLAACQKVRSRMTKGLNGQPLMSAVELRARHSIPLPLRRGEETTLG